MSAYREFFEQCFFFKINFINPHCQHSKKLIIRHAFSVENNIQLFGGVITAEEN